MTEDQYRKHIADFNTTAAFGPSVKLCSDASRRRIPGLFP